MITVSKVGLLYALNTIGQGFDRKTLDQTTVVLEGSSLRMSDYKNTISVDIGADFTPILEWLSLKRLGLSFNELRFWLQNISSPIDDIVATPKVGTILFACGRNKLKCKVDPTVIVVSAIDSANTEEVCTLDQDLMVRAFRIQELRSGKVPSPILEKVLIRTLKVGGLETYGANGFVFGKSTVPEVVCPEDNEFLVHGDVLGTVCKVKWGGDIFVGINTKTDAGKQVFGNGDKRSVVFTDGVVTIQSPIGADVDVVAFPASHIDAAVVVSESQQLFSVPSKWLSSELTTFNQLGFSSQFRVPCNIWTYTDESGRVNIATSSQLAGKLDVDADTQHVNSAVIDGDASAVRQHMLVSIDPGMLGGLLRYLSGQVDISVLEIGKLETNDGLLVTSPARTDFVGCAVMNHNTYL